MKSAVLPEQDAFFEELYRQYVEKLVRYASHKLDRNIAQDVVQDTFHDAIRNVDKLMIHENPGGWLMQTVKYKIMENQRRQIRYTQRFLSLDSDELFVSPSSPDDFVSELCQSHLASPIEKIRHVLTEEEMYLLKRLIIDKASHLDVAAELGITVWTCQKRLERIRKKLYRSFPERHKP